MSAWAPRLGPPTETEKEQDSSWNVPVGFSAIGLFFAGGLVHLFIGLPTAAYVAIELSALTVFVLALVREGRRPRGRR